MDARRKGITMADHPSAFSDGRRRVAASIVSIGLAFNLLVVPWVAATANASTPVVTNYTGTGIDAPQGITAGPDGALWFANEGLTGEGSSTIGRITTGGAIANYTGAASPVGITAGPDGALWFTNFGVRGSAGSIGRITTGGAATGYLGTGISNPVSIAAGPDGALWFTNVGNNSIGRITTDGAVTNYTGAGISSPSGIAAGPDGALWFTNFGNNSIGRITTGGVVTNYTGTGISSPNGDRRRPGRCVLVHELWKQHHRAHHDGRGRQQLHGNGIKHPERDRRRPGRRLVVHELLETALYRAQSRRAWGRHQLHGNGHQQPERDRRRPGRRLVVHERRETTPSGASPLGPTLPPPRAFSSRPTAPRCRADRRSSMRARSSPEGMASVTFEVTGGSLSDQVVATATPTYVGWLAQWNTTTVPNGTYTLQVSPPTLWGSRRPAPRSPSR